VKSHKRLLSILVVGFLVLTALVGQSADAIFSADVPIFYGDGQFRARILEQTKGERSPIGLVLSGGSARAFAHIGVLRYLEEQGIVPDFIISNSMGSIVGLLYAAGLSPDQIFDAVTGVSIQSLFDMTVPLRGGLLDSSRFLSNTASVLGDGLDLADLPIPIIVVAEDLVTKRQLIISEGDFYTVLKASYALPVYFDPVDYRGHLLIDGGVTNLVPVDLAFDYADQVIVSTTFYDVDTLDLFNPLTILNVSLDIGKRRLGVAELKEHLDEVIWIRNDVEDVSFMEFSRVDYLSKKGYESAQKQQQALSLLPKSSRWSSLAELRNQHQVNLERSQQRYKLYEHVSMHRRSSILGMAITQERGKLLTNDAAVGLSYKLGLGDFTVLTNLGGSFSFTSQDAFTFMPTMTAQVEYHLFNHMRATAYTSAAYNLGAKAPMMGAGATVEGRMFAWDRQILLRLLQSYEHLSVFHPTHAHQNWEEHTYLLNSTAAIELKLNQNSLWQLAPSALSVSYQFLGDYQMSRSFVAFNAQSGVIHQPTGLFGDADIWGRFAVDGKGDVPLLITDGFRTTDASLKSQGHNLAVSTNSTNYLVGVNATIGWRPPLFSPSVAEMLIFKNSSVAVYSDLVFAEETFMPKVNLGLELHTDISLLGIRTLPTTVYGGWDQAAGGFVWGFWFTVEL
jgi:NTE family protein